MILPGLGPEVEIEPPSPHRLFVVVLALLGLLSLYLIASPASAISGVIPIEEFNPEESNAVDSVEFHSTDLSFNAVGYNEKVISQIRFTLSPSQSMEFTLSQGSGTIPGNISFTHEGLNDIVTINIGDQHFSRSSLSLMPGERSFYLFPGIKTVEYVPGIGIETDAIYGPFLPVPNILGSPIYALDLSSVDPVGVRIGLVPNDYYAQVGGQAADENTGGFFSQIAKKIDNLLGISIFDPFVSTVGALIPIVLSILVWFKVIFVDHFFFTVATYEMIILALAANKSRDIFQFFKKAWQYNQKLIEFLIWIVEKIIQIFTRVIATVRSLVP